MNLTHTQPPEQDSFAGRGLKQARVFLVEESRIGSAIASALRDHYQPEIEVTNNLSGPARSKCDLMVAAIDNGSLPRLQFWQEVAASLNVSLLCVHIQQEELVVGPLIAPGKPGCIECWSKRYYNGRHNAKRFAASSGFSLLESQPLLTPLIVSLTGNIAAHQVQAYVHGRCDSGEARYLDLETLSLSRERYLPHSACSRCGTKAWDNASDASICIRPRFKTDPSADRLKPDVKHLLPELQRNYVGRHTGIIREMIMSFPIRYVAAATAGVCFGHTSRLEPCSGFCSSYEDAQTVAILEALERYSSFSLRARRPAVRGSAARLGQVVVDPRRFGLPSVEENNRTSLLTRYTDHLEMDFVWGHSFAKEQQVLVPAQLAFYTTPREKEPIFAVEGSNGCSLGSNPEEAILHGLLEVIERDSALMTWYVRIGHPAFDPMECADLEVRARCRRLQHEGYRVLALDATTDFGVPAILLLARLQRREGRLPCFLAVGAAHYHPDKALLKATRELTACFSRYTEELKRDFGWNRAHELAEDPTRVRTIEDHALLYCLPRPAGELEFLEEDSGTTSLENLRERGRTFWSADLSEELLRVIQGIVRTGCDVIAVDQTSPELGLIGMFDYKALVPGAIPMSFGNISKRLDGIDRLDSVLRAQNRPLNPSPHPFC